MAHIVDPEELNPEDSKENIIKIIWESFLSLDKFTKTLIFSTLLLLVVTPYFVLNSQTLNQHAAAPTSPFVTRSGTAFYLNGAPFKFAGFNIYQANSIGNCSYTMGNGSALDTALSSIGPMQVFRTWFFQAEATNNGARDWSAFDHTLAVAKAHNVRVIATLGNQWGSCESPTSMYKWDSWYTGGYKTQVLPTTTVPYRNWVAEVVTRYKDDPTIAMWQIMNEAELKIDNTSTCGPSADLYNFASDISSLIKSIDPNHLVSMGTLGGSQCGTKGSDYQTLHSLPNIDTCEFHDYGNPTQALPSNFSSDLSACNADGKPLFVGEMGMKPNDPGVNGTLQGRADLYNAKLSAQFAAGAQGILIWSWNNSGSSMTSYQVGSGDPTLGIVNKYASQFGSIYPIQNPSPTTQPTATPVLPTPTSTPTPTPKTSVPTPTTKPIPTTTSAPITKPSPTTTPKPLPTATPIPINTLQLISNLSVSDSNAKNWSIQLNNFSSGNILFGDRGYTLTSIPQALKNASWIRSANNSKFSTNNPLVSFYLSRQSTVYLPVDTRITALPSWLKNGKWTNTGVTVTDNEPTPKTFTLYSKVFSQGQVSLGALPSSFNMYSVIAGNPLPITAGDGLLGLYFANKNLNGFPLYRIDPNIDFNWSNGSPMNNVPEDNFSVRWTGSILPKYSQTYTFYATTDDGVRVWVNNQLVIDAWFDQPATERKSSSIFLNANQKYSIKVEYYQHNVLASAKLSWSSDSTPKEIIPQSQLYSQ